MGRAVGRRALSHLLFYGEQGLGLGKMMVAKTYRAFGGR